MDRKYYNKQILKILSEIVDKEEFLRFCQILYSYNIINPDEDWFYKESKETYESLLKNIGQNAYYIILENDTDKFINILYDKNSAEDFIRNKNYYYKVF